MAHILIVIAMTSQALISILNYHYHHRHEQLTDLVDVVLPSDDISVARVELPKAGTWKFRVVGFTDVPHFKLRS